MPRRARVFVEGGLCHVYNRVASGKRVFDELDAVLQREIGDRA